MVTIGIFSTIFLILHLVEANFTRVSKENVLLSRRKRYLNFPMGSNFVVTASHIQSFLQVQPRGWAILLEADVPFALPSDTRQLKEKKKKAKRYAVDRQHFLDTIGEALTGTGFNGKICIRKIICTIFELKEVKRKSMIRDMLYAAFVYPEDNPDRDKCNKGFDECPIPFLEGLIDTLYLQ